MPEGCLRGPQCSSISNPWIRRVALCSRGPGGAVSCVPALLEVPFFSSLQSGSARYLKQVESHCVVTRVGLVPSDAIS